uniref:phage portal protein n=1 Tax=uncultured Anaerovibrio sp. TaxID=361586 RepID=UPI002637EF89
RAADEAINTPVGAAAINTSATHAIGTGLTLFPRPKFSELGLTVKESREWIKKTRAEFELWAESKECDLYRRNNFYDLQHIAYLSYMTDGDAFALFRRKKANPNNPYTLRIQLLEATRVSNPINSGFTTVNNVEMFAPISGHRIISGVEVDKDGAIAAYWVSNKVPYDHIDITGTVEWQRVEAYGSRSGVPNILQICHDVRADQYRGVPYLAPVLETLKQTSRYTTAELASAIVKSFFALFFTSSAASGLDLNSMLGQGIEMDPGAPVVDVGEYALGPGTLNALPMGVDVKAMDASNAQSTFGIFTQELIKQIGAALGQPYEVLMKNFTSSYSASRAALLQAWDEYKQRRIWFARDFCQPVYEVWLAEAVANGRIDCPGFFDDPRIRKAWCNAEWYGPTMSILDPVKDIKGSILRVDSGLSTGEREAAEMTGSDFEDNLQQLAYERELRESLGLDQSATAFTTEGGEENGKDNDNDDDSKVLEGDEQGGGERTRRNVPIWRNHS